MLCHRRVLPALIATVLLAACSSTPKKDDAQSSMPAAATVQPASPSPQAMESEAQKLQRIIQLLASKSIYFDYDRYEIKAEYQDVLQRDYAALKAAPNLKLMVEGNGDERGSREYNLALGQKRAEAVKRALQLLGVPEARLEAISYGKEKPRATCHEEKCWAENRRVDLRDAKP